MAQQVNITLVDDLDGSEASETVSFALDGTSYEIDLNDEHAEALRGALAGYLGHARKAAGRRPAGTARKAAAAPAGGTPAREIRDWARSNGFTVPDRGRIPGEVRDAFDAAN